MLASKPSLKHVYIAFEIDQMIYKVKPLKTMGRDVQCARRNFHDRENNENQGDQQVDA